jgi:hypothetical protein
VDDVMDGIAEAFGKVADHADELLRSAAARDSS